MLIRRDPTLSKWPTRKPTKNERARDDLTQVQQRPTQAQNQQSLQSCCVLRARVRASVRFHGRERTGARAACRRCHRCPTSTCPLLFFSFFFFLGVGVWLGWGGGRQT